MFRMSSIYIDDFLEETKIAKESLEILMNSTTCGELDSSFEIVEDSNDALHVQTEMLL